jgi:hypothetical protein
MQQFKQIINKKCHQNHTNLQMYSNTQKAGIVNFTAIKLVKFLIISRKRYKHLEAKNFIFAMGALINFIQVNSQ